MENKAKVTLYLKNSNDFMFGVFDNAEDYSKNNKADKGIHIDGKKYGIWQGDIYEEIRWRVKDKAIFPWDKEHKASYDDVTRTLLDSLGIDGILKRIILPYQATILNEYEVEFLERCWKIGKRPYKEAIDMDKNADKIKPINFFKANFVEYYPNQSKPLSLIRGWTQWAFTYFGELKPDPDKELKIEYYMDKK